jgi:hypothetical protein
MLLKPSTLLYFHHLLTKRKYRALFSSERGCRPGPKGPTEELIDAVVVIKRRNPTCDCPRIAQQITLAFGVGIDKDVARRMLGKNSGWSYVALVSCTTINSPAKITFGESARDSENAWH